MKKLEYDIFKRKQLLPEKLEPYGFKKKGGVYVLSKPIMDGSFRADVEVTDSGDVSGTLVDTEMDEEYVNFRVETANGPFVTQVREEYTALLEDIGEKCFKDRYFISDQSNRICALIKEKYNAQPEFLFDKYPTYAVFRKKPGKKWFALLMDVDRDRLEAGGEGQVEILNIRAGERAESFREKSGVYPAYHQNKKYWVSVLLDDTLKDGDIMDMVAVSYGEDQRGSQWIVPANPKYYDVFKAFDQSDTIMWKQSSSIAPGDTVYLYMAAPYSAVMFKCTALETDIPRNFGGKNVRMKKAMRIRLLRRYDRNDVTFSVLNQYGVRAVRGPRRIDGKLIERLNSGYDDTTGDRP